MSKEQIEEMAKAMCGNGMSNGNCVMDDEPCNLECVYGCCAERLHAKGYRKQSEGEWTSNNGKTLYKCSVCNQTCPYDAQGDDISYWTCKYCPNCGARMSGG